MRKSLFCWLILTALASVNSAAARPAPTGDRAAPAAGVITPGYPLQQLPPNSATRPVLRALRVKTFIRLEIQVQPDNSTSVTILESTGYKELDDAVLADIKTWRWQAARQNGQPVPWTKSFRINLQAE